MDKLELTDGKHSVHLPSRELIYLVIRQREKSDCQSFNKPNSSAVHDRRNLITGITASLEKTPRENIFISFRFAKLISSKLHCETVGCLAL